MSPAFTRKATMAPGTCADSVVWRTASTTASRLKLSALAAPAPEAEAACTATVASGLFSAAAPPASARLRTVKTARRWRDIQISLFVFWPLGRPLVRYLTM